MRDDIRHAGDRAPAVRHILHRNQYPAIAISTAVPGKIQRLRAPPDWTSAGMMG